MINPLKTKRERERGALYLRGKKIILLEGSQAMKAHLNKFKNSVRTSKRTPHFTITKISWLMLFKEIIAVYSENHAKPINTKCSITDCQSRWFT
jgi:hypothetical protein